MNINDIITIDHAKYNNECFIVGGGPSLIGFNWALLANKFTIAINRAYEVLPTANLLYFTDTDYWERHKDAMCAHGAPICRGAITANQTNHPRVNDFLLTGARGIETLPGKLRHGSNSPYAALNLAGVHLGFKTVYLMGVDMKWGEGKKTHWHDGHKRIDPESGYANMINAYDQLVHILPQHGFQVININSGSRIKTLPTVSYEQIFGPNCFLNK